MPEPELTREAKEAIRGYILKLVVPSGTILAVVSFGLGFLIKDVARKDAYSTAFEARAVPSGAPNRCSDSRAKRWHTLILA